eukprot:2218674-Lingulodinium_polyedra.AAC.1
MGAHVDIVHSHKHLGIIHTQGGSLASEVTNRNTKATAAYHALRSGALRAGLPVPEACQLADSLVLSAHSYNCG